MDSRLPSETKVVIVGGGIVGCSIAYHLTKLGWKDVLLLEQNRLAGGTTWHAAGLVGRLRTSTTLTKINQYSADLYAALEKETGHPVGWKQVGSLIVAKSADRMTQLRRTAAMAEWFGVEVELIGPKAAQERWPLLRVDDVLGAAWLPRDGKVIPQEVTVALAKAAQARGAKVCENVHVAEVLQRDGRAAGVRAFVVQASACHSGDTGSSASQPDKLKLERQPPVDIRAEFVVLAGGMWTRELGLRCGVTIPLYPVEHHYVVTEPIAGAFDGLPVGRDPDLCLYFRGEGDAVVLGAFQAQSKAWMIERVPDEFSFQLLEPDWEKFSEPLKHGKWRIPALETCKFAKFVNGPESFTPDNNFILGEAPELKNLFVAAGFNSVGIASGGGAGKYLAEWMLAGEPTADLWSVDIRRFGPWANNRAFLRERVEEVLGLHYQLAWPNREYETGRGLRKSPLHERLAAAGACFGVKNGWERPNWFALVEESVEALNRSTVQPAPASTLQRFNASTALPATQPEVCYSFGRQNWFPSHALEHRAAREAVAVFDQTGFSKYVLKGRDAVTVLQRLCGNNVDVPLGRTVYTGLFNERGGFESDLTLVRLAADEFYLISGTAQTVRDQDWISRHIRPDEHAELLDVTGSIGVLGVMGPHSRALLQRVTDADLSTAAFPFGTAKQISIGAATVRAVRITYVGELGWELHAPTEQLALVYDTVMAAGKDLGVTDAGHYAINSLRLEKGYRAWGADISPDDTPLEAGLSFAIDWNKDFLGRAALLKQKAAGLKRHLVIFVVQDPEPVLWGSELIYRDGQAVGYTTSGSYGHTVGGAIAMGYVNNAAGVNGEFIKTGRFEINITGQRYPAQAHLRPPYDPDRKRIRG
jgi:4-methylaminobutanoate oxidase (formaldehyde-forming)